MARRASSRLIQEYAARSTSSARAGGPVLAGSSPPARRPRAGPGARPRWGSAGRRGGCWCRRARCRGAPARDRGRRAASGLPARVRRSSPTRVRRRSLWRFALALPNNSLGLCRRVVDCPHAFLHLHGYYPDDQPHEQLGLIPGQVLGVNLRFVASPRHSTSDCVSAAPAAGGPSEQHLPVSGPSFRLHFPNSPPLIARCMFARGSECRCSVCEHCGPWASRCHRPIIDASSADYITQRSPKYRRRARYQ